jgi:hypothetical protein
VEEGGGALCSQGVGAGQGDNREGVAGATIASLGQAPAAAWLTGQSDVDKHHQDVKRHVHSRQGARAHEWTCQRREGGRMWCRAER